MARFSVTGLDDVYNQMRAMGQESGAVARAMVEAGAAEVQEAWKQAAQEHGLIDTGEMIESIAPGKISNGALIYCDIYPQGKDSKGVRNAEKAFYLHYGTSSISPTRWVDDADTYSEERTIPVMEAIWEQFIATGQIGGGIAGRAGGIRISKG